MKFCSEELWESLARADDTATFFQTPAWHRIAARHFKAESAPLLFDFPESQGGPACLPLLRDKRWGRWRYFSPFGTYTAVVCPRMLDPHEIAVIEAALAPLNIQLASSPFTRNPVRVGKAIPAQVQLLDLTTLDPSNVMRDWERDLRRRFRGAQASGVRVRPASSDGDWEAYTDLYRQSVKRWGEKATSHYPPTLLKEIRNNLDGTPGFRLWLAEKDGVIGAGFMGFYHNQHAALWHAAATPNFFKLGGVQILYHDMIEDAAVRHFKTFDLLGSSGLSGVEAFKASLGARTVRYDTFLNRTGLVGTLAGLKARLTK
jgi:hypothetical protein